MTLPDLALLASAGIALLVGGWGSGFWMGTYFVSRATYEALEKRVRQLERGNTNPL